RGRCCPRGNGPLLAPGRACPPSSLSVLLSAPSDVGASSPCACPSCVCLSAHPFGAVLASAAELRCAPSAAVSVVPVRGLDVLVDRLGGVEGSQRFERGDARRFEETMRGFDGLS